MDDLALCCELEEDMKVMVRCFVEVCRTRRLKINGDKSKVMVLGGEEGLECEGLENRMLEFKYFRCVLDELDTDGAECRRKVAKGRRVTVAIIS